MGFLLLLINIIVYSTVISLIIAAVIAIYKHFKH